MSRVDATQALLTHLDTAITSGLAGRKAHLETISVDAGPLVDAAAALLSRGKRLRPQFCYWGWRAIADNAVPDVLPQAEAGDSELACILRISEGLEFFHAAALVHDDIIDRSDSRRGQPSAHRRFELLYGHEDDPAGREHFGQSAAILLGDLLLTWSHELFATAMNYPFASERKLTTQHRINQMCTEVMAGQYLDVFAESAWQHRTPEAALAESLTVLRYKSAKYSVQAPLLIGASVAGATVGQVDALSRYGLALGEAFQLRDDILGVFGDPETTGKPAGDDIREGKRTYLVLLTRNGLPRSMQRVLDEMMGNPALDAEQIDAVRRLASETGAVKAVEAMISERVDTARAALAEGDFPAEAYSELDRLIAATAYRTV